MKAQIDVVKNKIRKILLDCNYDPIYVNVEPTLGYMPAELKGRIHAYCRANVEPHNELYIEVSNWVKWSTISIIDKETGEKVHKKFRGDDAIENMLEFIRNKLPAF